MSLILDALNRAEHEREGEATAPAFKTVEAVSQAKAKPVWLHRWPYELLLILILGSYFIYTQFGGAPASTEKPAAIKPALQDQVQAVNIPKPVTEAETVAPAKAKVAVNATQSNAEIESLYASKPAESPQPMADPVTRAPRLIPDSVLEASRQQALQNRAAYTQQQRGETPAAAVEQIPVEEQPLQTFPSLNDLPWQIRRNIPSIDYGIHVYSKKPGGSIVQINGEMRHVGDQVAVGVVLQEVLSDGVILEHQGTSFKLGALNSWVNN